MPNTTTLTFGSEQTTVLDEAELASIIGGDSLKEWFIKKVIEVVVDCLTGSVDEIISAAKEGYQEAR